MGKDGLGGKNDKKVRIKKVRSKSRSDRKNQDPMLEDKEDQLYYAESIQQSFSQSYEEISNEYTD